MDNNDNITIKGMERIGKFLFLHAETTPMGNKVRPDYLYPVQLNEYQAQDLQRYCYTLYYQDDIPIDFNKVIKQALAWYLKKEVKPADESKIAKLKKAEAKEIEQRNKQDKLDKLNNFEWIIKDKEKETETDETQ